MIVEKTKLNDLLLIKPKLYNDDRGFFYVSWNSAELEGFIGKKNLFVQDNHSKSNKNVLRGLHYQIKYPQGKLVRTTYGSVFDVVVDLRKNSSTFGKTFEIELSAKNKYQLWIPPGFAHGFLVLSKYAEFQYKTTNLYKPEYEKTIIWNDKILNINWPLEKKFPILSDKDKKGLNFEESEYF